MAGRKLPRTAYELEQGQEYIPFTSGQTLTEFTIKAVISGAILGMVFGAANTYLGLRASMALVLVIVDCSSQ